jgi:hypothetical protein
MGGVVQQKDLPPLVPMPLGVSMIESMWDKGLTFIISKSGVTSFGVTAYMSETDVSSEKLWCN